MEEKEVLPNSITTIKYLTIPQIIDKYSDFLSDEDKEKLLNNNTLDLNMSNKIELLNKKLNGRK